MEEKTSSLKLSKISQCYFDYMAKTYPVMCLSDEFYFFPRAKKGIDYLDRLDCLDKDKIKEAVSFVKNLKRGLEAIKHIDLESEIDHILLRQNMCSFLREFEHYKIWQREPTLYLKIFLLGIEHLAVKISNIKSNQIDIEGSLLSRIKKIPKILNEAKANLTKVPRLYLEAGVEMTKTSIDYFKDSLLRSIDKRDGFYKSLNSSINIAIQSLEDFSKFLKKISINDMYMQNREIFEKTLLESFSYKKSLEEIFDIAYQEYHKTLKGLEELSKKIDPKKTWQKILYEYTIDAKNDEQLLNLYSNHIKQLKNFFYKKDVFSLPKEQKLKVTRTPFFMIPIRASASYSCPITNNHKEPAFFYVTPEFGLKAKAFKKGYSSVHIEYIFVTSHETYPGHHLLDSIRKNLKNPIRQQIESPLFYEGWASYAETLTDSMGYIKNPLQKLVGLRRQAWRAVRAMLDVGIRIGKLNIEDAGMLLKNLGYAPETVKVMLRHYILTPCYQLCYTIGKYEIEKLERKFALKLGLKKFHDMLLYGGQIPFDLIEKRMENVICKKNS